MTTSMLTNAISLVHRVPDAISIALLQRHLSLGYGAACALMDQLIATAVVSQVDAAENGNPYRLTAPGTAE